MKEIGETFLYEDKFLTVVEQRTCYGCYFDNNSLCRKYFDMGLVCGEKFRTDRKNIIFKLENKFKFGK